jgi:hypothetical protein
MANKNDHGPHHHEQPSTSNAVPGAGQRDGLRISPDQRVPQTPLPRWWLTRSERDDGLDRPSR